MSDNNLRSDSDITIKRSINVSRNYNNGYSTRVAKSRNPKGKAKLPKTGHSKPPSFSGASPDRRNIYPEVRERNKRAHQQIRRVCEILDKTLGRIRRENNRELKEKEISKALVSLILDKAKAPKNSQLFKEVEKLKSLLTVFKISSLRGLEQLAQGKTAKVLVDTKKEIAYKLIGINEGEVGGTFPKEIRIRPEDNQILISGCKTHSLLKMIRAVEISNEHGGPLFTEIAGFTEDGDLIICQPYIKNLESINMFGDTKSQSPCELNNCIERLGLKPLGDIGSPFAISLVNGKYAIFDDLHGENVLKTKEGTPYLVDSLATRYLTEQEIKLLETFLTEKEITVEDESIKKSKRKPKTMPDHESMVSL